MKSRMPQRALPLIVSKLISNRSRRMWITKPLQELLNRIRGSTLFLPKSLLPVLAWRSATPRPRLRSINRAYKRSQCRLYRWQHQARGMRSHSPVVAHRTCVRQKYPPPALRLTGEPSETVPSPPLLRHWSGQMARGRQLQPHLRPRPGRLYRSLALLAKELRRESPMRLKLVDRLLLQRKIDRSGK